MGEVYRARDRKLDRDVAIKILPEALASDAERIARFEREARTLAVLNHPNIAHIYGLEDTGAVRALVMELVEGPTLADRIARGPVPFDELLPIAAQIAEALETAHEQGIIHRDLKPANIKVRPDGTVKVLDFGLAKALDSPSASGANAMNSPTFSMHATQAGLILGTAAYMSPEQAAGKPADKRSDLWAFGVVLFEMLSGRSVFTGETVSHVLASVLKTGPDWTALPAGTPEAIRRLLRRCLEKDRKRRLDSAADARIEIEDARREIASPARPMPPAPSRRRERIAWTTAGLALVALLGAVATLVMRRPQPVDLAASQFLISAPQQTTFSPNMTAQAVSPDGRQLALVARNSDGTSLLWIRPLDSLTARVLVGTDDASAPFWSADSRSVAFFARGKLKKIEVAGGPAQTLADATFAGGGTWNRDGVIVFAPRMADALYRISAGGGAATPLTSLDQSRREVTHAWPFFLPDQRHFLFVGRTFPAENSAVFVGSLDSKEVKLVVRASSATKYSPPGYLLFLRESTLMAQAFDAERRVTSGDAVPIAERVAADLVSSGQRGAAGFAVSENGTLLYRPAIAMETQLVWVDRTGKTVASVAPAGTYNNLALSPDETRVAFDRPGPGNDVWLTDLQRRTTSRFTFQPPNNNVAVWSPDGGTVAFASSRNGALDVYQRKSNASGPDELLLKLAAAPIVFPSDWSADGRYLAYYRSDPRTQLDLWILPLFGDRKPFPILRTEFNESQGQFSPDGKWMAYVSDLSGTSQIYVQSFPEITGTWQISIDGGSQPRWRRDGKELFYLAPNGKLMAVRIKTGATVAAEDPRPLFQTTLPAVAPRQTYAVSADGQRFFMTAPLEAGSPPMTIVLNWTGLLKR
jgi:serine/threonine protein kinase